jgi:hypothetical protein
MNQIINPIDISHLNLLQLNDDEIVVWNKFWGNVLSKRDYNSLNKP